MARCLAHSGSDAEACISGCERAYDSCADECGSSAPPAAEPAGAPKPAEPPSKREPPSHRPPVAASTDGFTGSFDIADGVNPNGSRYHGKVEISKTGEAYRLRWDIPGSPYAGVGLLVDGVLGVGWGGGGGQGVIVYRVEGKRLVGDWTASGAGGALGTEVLEGPPGLPGHYRIVSASLPEGGASYTGSVDIKQTGSVFVVDWDTSAGQYVGVGLEVGGLLVVGWGNGVGVVAYQRNGARLEGTWAAPGGSDLGREVLEPR